MGGVRHAGTGRSGPAIEQGLGARLAPALVASLATHGALALALLAFAPDVVRTPGDSRVPLRMVDRRPQAAPAVLRAQAVPGAPEAAVRPAARSVSLPARTGRPGQHPVPDGRTREKAEPTALPPAAAPTAGMPEPARPPPPDGAGPSTSTTEGQGIAPGEGTGAGTEPGAGDAAARGPATRAGGAGSDGRGRGDGSATLAGPGDERSRYGLEVRRRVDGAKRFPEAARRRERDGKVFLRISVEADGRVSVTSIVTPSPWPELDRAALAAAGQLGVLPPPPGGPIDVLVPVHFTLRRP